MRVELSDDYKKYVQSYGIFPETVKDKFGKPVRFGDIVAVGNPKTKINFGMYIGVQDDRAMFTVTWGRYYSDQSPKIVAKRSVKTHNFAKVPGSNPDLLDFLRGE